MNYSTMDKLVHSVVFGVPGLQIVAADIEKVVFGARLSGTPAGRPIFVSSLPRAGTTILLQVLAQFRPLAVHTYRDMPLVMAPLLWSRLCGAFHISGDPQARAHGDGMSVGYDSPEAFEEILWHSLWPEKYRKDRIALWQTTDATDDARSFFIEHMRKIIALRCSDRIEDGRYVSKNNANIARLNSIHDFFPDATILVPFRNPADHAMSLLNQHRNFSDLHAKDPFARRYMANLCHFEFGALHRLIDFPGVDELTRGRSPFDPDYWLGYWVAAFEHILSKRERVLLVSYEALCDDPPSRLAVLCDLLGISKGPTLDQAAGMFRSPSGKAGKTANFDPDLFAHARTLYASLLDAAAI